MEVSGDSGREILGDLVWNVDSLQVGSKRCQGTTGFGRCFSLTFFGVPFDPQPDGFLQVLKFCLWGWIC